MIGVFVGILSIIVCIIVIIALKKKLTQHALDEIQQYKTYEFQKERKKYLERLDEDFSDARQVRQEQLNSIDKEIETKKKFNESLLKIREEELDNIINEKRISRQGQLDKEIEEWAQSAQEAAHLYQGMITDRYKEEIENEKLQLQSILKEISEYKEKRDAINKEILRSRALEEKQDFYRIQLDVDSREDIQILTDIKQRLNKTDLLNKLIYDNYIARPAKEMVKRVLEGKNPCGIYKVTNIETNEVYIGKSVKIADRFLNHIKSACGLEGVAESQFQRALKKYGIGNFTWELLEECSKENLTEREKYYIMFFGTKEYGYNQREG